MAREVWTAGEGEDGGEGAGVYGDMAVEAALGDGGEAGAGGGEGGEGVVREVGGEVVEELWREAVEGHLCSGGLAGLDL